MNLFRKLEQEVGEWSEENFADQPDVNPLLGSFEEEGELAGSIDFESQPDEEELDAVGDILVYLADFCYRRGLDYQEAFDDSVAREPEHDDFFREWARTTGILTRSVLKQRQGIRLDEDRVGKEAEQDALTQMLAALRELAEQRGYTLEEAVNVAWYDEVIDREWDSDYRN